MIVSSCFFNHYVHIFNYLYHMDVNNSLVIASIHDINMYPNPQTAKLVAHINSVAQITIVLQIWRWQYMEWLGLGFRKKYCYLQMQMKKFFVHPHHHNQRWLPSFQLIPMQGWLIHQWIHWHLEGGQLFLQLELSFSNLNGLHFSQIKHGNL